MLKSMVKLPCREYTTWRWPFACILPAFLDILVQEPFLHGDEARLMLVRTDSFQDLICIAVFSCKAASVCSERYWVSPSSTICSWNDSAELLDNCYHIRYSCSSSSIFFEINIGELLQLFFSSFLAMSEKSQTMMAMVLYAFFSLGGWSASILRMKK